MRHIHLDLLGGIAGDMFVAALSEAFPDHTAVAIRHAETIANVACRLVPHNDGTLAGARFVVEDDHHRDHHHTHWADIRKRLTASALPDPALQHALGIFSVLAEAEGQVHGIPPDDVAFHEIGAADSIADIVAASCLIAAVEPASWSVSAIPVGTGQIRTAHGIMPVPAPATALLLRGFATRDDDIPGERITPTGAAILRHLRCAPRRPGGVMGQTGFGFGARRLPGISNCLRVLVFDCSATTATPAHRDLAVISFEVDDQSGEDLAAGLDAIRSINGVHDVIQMAALGKKGRFAVHVQVLVRPDCLDAAVEACFRETTTIGLRTHLVQGRTLHRRFVDTEVAGRPIRVKLVERPNGVTGKAEADNIAAIPTHAARSRLRREAEQLSETETR